MLFLHRDPDFQPAVAGEIGRGGVSGACTPVGRRYHRSFSDLDGAVDEASVSVRTHKRALFWDGLRKAAPGPEMDWFACSRPDTLAWPFLDQSDSGMTASGTKPPVREVRYRYRG
jgi:hypothetical protein